MGIGRVAARICRRPWPLEAIRLDPLGYLAEDRANQRALADQMEMLADALPMAASRAGAATAGARLQRLVAQSLPAEEAALLAPVETLAADDETTLRQIALARREAATIAGLALELTDDLESLAREGSAAEAEALGYRLRACFEALRRRLDWIEAAILPQARLLLTPPLTAAVGERLAEMARARPMRLRAGLAVLEGRRGY